MSASAAVVAKDENFQHYSEGDVQPDFSNISSDTIAFVEKVFQRCLEITRLMEVCVSSEQNYNESLTQIGEYLRLAGHALCKQRAWVQATASASCAMHDLTRSASGESGQDQNDSNYLGRVAEELCGLQAWPYYFRSDMQNCGKDHILEKIVNLRQALQAASNLLCPSPSLSMPPAVSAADAPA